MTKDPWDIFIEKHPLARFSFYLNGRVSVLQEISAEVLENLNNVVEDGVGRHERLSRAEMLFWLWTLGAYEVVRTMHQARQCFTERVQAELAELKRELAKVRMPAAKMEKMGERIPINSRRSASGFDDMYRDMLAGDPTEPESARELIGSFAAFFMSLEADDILGSHESAYEKRS